MSRALGVLTVVFLGCASAPRVQVLASLTPVDASRPHFIYGPVQGTACGEGAEVRAFDDLFRLAPVDGFVAVIVSQDASKNCVTVTARPITYGCEPKSFGPSATAAPVHVVPGPSTCAATTTSNCPADCATFAGKLGGSEFETSAFKNRCVVRCNAGDAPFLTCAKAAVTALDVRKCDSN